MKLTYLGDRTLSVLPMDYRKKHMGSNMMVKNFKVPNFTYRNVKKDEFRNGQYSQFFI